MNFSLKKFWNDNGIGGVLIALVVAYIIYMFFNNLMSKGSIGSELMTQERQKAYSNTSGNPVPSEDVVTSGNEVYSSINDPSNLSGMPPCGNQNPADLLPSDANSQWAELNPSGKGELSNINLLKSSWAIGIDTVGQSLRNANQQLRSDPVIPQVPTGPWNQTTISGDTMRVPFEIGVGSQ